MSVQTIFAPAKVNLYLHVTGRRADGYHLLDSLMSFADIGDEIQIDPSENFDFEITGPFSHAFQGREVDTGPGSSNLVMRAVWGLSRLTGKAPDFKITLRKNLPLGAGLGGGSADAAATLWGLLKHWDLPIDMNGLDNLMLSLGADVPVCFACKTSRASGIGERLEPIDSLPETPIVLIHPGRPCNTKEIFSHFNGDFKEMIAVPKEIDDTEAMYDFLSGTENVLSKAAVKRVPEIQNILNALDVEDRCTLARMSGSGSACFGLFEDEGQARSAARTLKMENPDWWVQETWLGRAERY